MSEKIVKKLTIKECVGGKPVLLAIAMLGQTVSKDDAGKEVRSVTGRPQPIMRVLGQVIGFTPGEGDNGSFVKLKGSFQAINLQTGEVINTAQAILPDAVGEPLANAIHNGAEAIEFAVEIFVEYDESAATMYKFTARSLIPSATPKPIASLLERMAAQGVEMSPVKQIAAPTLSAAALAAQQASEKKADDAKALAAAAAATKKGK